jgi:anti-anti-sigma factor
MSPTEPTPTRVAQNPVTADNPKAVCIRSLHLMADGDLREFGALIRPEAVTAMADDAYPVQWTGQQAVVTLPQHIDTSNADQIREQLLWIINRGAAVLIADLSGTVSCDYSGAEALARAYHRAIANGTELRLVVTANVVRRVLTVNGFDRLVAVYPDLDGAVAAGRREQGTRTADDAARAEELLEVAVASVFDVGLILQAAVDLPPGVIAQRITEALRRLDDLVREIRDHMFAERGQGIESGLAWSRPRYVPDRSVGARNRPESLHRHVAQRAHAVHSAAADTAALLEQQADLLGHPCRIDYPTEIKRWRALADQAGEIAERWERQP